MTYQDALAGPPHAMLLVVLFESSQPRLDRGVFFGLVLFRAERVVAQRVEADGFGLIRVEVFGKYWP